MCSGFAAKLPVRVAGIRRLLRLPPLLWRQPDSRQRVAPPRGGARLAADMGGKPQVALRVEPAGFRVGRQFAHDLGKGAEDRLDILGFEPPFGPSLRLS